MIITACCACCGDVSLTPEQAHTLLAAALMVSHLEDGGHLVRMSSTAAIRVEPPPEPKL